MGQTPTFFLLDFAKQLQITIGNSSYSCLGDNSTFKLYECPSVLFHTGPVLHMEDFRVSDKLAHPAVLSLPCLIKNKVAFDYEKRTSTIKETTLLLHGALHSGTLFNLNEQLIIPLFLSQFSQVFSD